MLASDGALELALGFVAKLGAEVPWKREESLNYFGRQLTARPYCVNVLASDPAMIPPGFQRSYLKSQWLCHRLCG